MPTATSLPPSCNLRQYRVKLFLMEAVSPEEAEDASPKLFPEVRLKEGSREYGVLLRVEYVHAGARFQSVIDGNFEFMAVVNPQNAAHAWVNGCTVLYGILRGLYSSSIAQCTGAVSVLPTVMMFDVVKKRIQQLMDAAKEGNQKEPTPPSPEPEKK